MAQKTAPSIPGLSEGMKKAGIPLSSVVKANGFLFLSGMPPLDLTTGAVVKDANIATQARLCLEGIKHVLTHAGSSMDKIVSMRVYCTDPTKFSAFNEVYKTYFPDVPPARTFIPVQSWQMGFDVELECIALE